MTQTGGQPFLAVKEIPRSMYNLIKDPAKGSTLPGFTRGDYGEYVNLEQRPRKAVHPSWLAYTIGDIMEPECHVDEHCCM